MLRKKVATLITASTRLCKCGKTVTVAAEDEQTVCECGEVVYDVKNDNNINGETTHEEADPEAGDSSTESTDSK